MDVLLRANSKRFTSNTNTITNQGSKPPGKVRASRLKNIIKVEDEDGHPSAGGFTVLDRVVCPDQPGGPDGVSLQKIKICLRDIN
jgi:hypothetical protein